MWGRTLGRFGSMRTESPSGRSLTAVLRTGGSAYTNNPYLRKNRPGPSVFPAVLFCLRENNRQANNSLKLPAIDVSAAKQGPWGCLQFKIASIPAGKNFRGHTNCFQSDWTAHDRAGAGKTENRCHCWVFWCRAPLGRGVITAQPKFPDQFEGIAWVGTCN